MDMEKLQAFFLWCMLVNFGIYALTAIAVLLLRDFICKMQARMFGLSEEAVRRAIFAYIAGYKLLIIVFNFVPWIAILIIR
jgi:hypothetical protein